MSTISRPLEQMRKQFIEEYKQGKKEGGMRDSIFVGQNADRIADWWIELLTTRDASIREALIAQVNIEISKCVTGESEKNYYLAVSKDSPFVKYLTPTDTTTSISKKV